MSWHKCVWAQTCMGTIACGLKRVWTQTCVGTKVSGHKRDVVGTSVSGHSHVVTVVRVLSCMGTNVVEPY